MKKIILVLNLLSISFLGFSQDQTNKGKDFWIPYPEHIDGTLSAMGLYITSDVASTGVITVGAVSIPFTVVPNNVVYKFLGPNASGDAPNTGVYLGGYQDNVVSGKGIHVTATSPVVVFAHIIRSARSGATLVLPTKVWGKEYIVSSFANSGTSASIPEIDVYASKPNTVIEITPTVTSRNGLHTPGVPFQVTIPNVGDVYQLQFAQNSDPSGTLVKSLASGTGCNPIAVFSATTWSGINCSSASGGDNLYQQLFPSSSWGKQFLTGPLKKVATNGTDNNVDIIRVFVKDPTTIITKTDNGVTTTLTGLIANSYYQYTASRPTFLQASNPIEVIQYITSQSCGSPQTNSDPEMIALSAVEQTINDITVFSAHTSYVPPGQSQVTTHYINVIMKTANTSLFRINGVIPNASFTAIPGTIYSYLKEDVTTRAASNPVFRLKADSGFIAIAYGFGNVESYGYNAGTNVKDLYQQIGVSTQYGIEQSPSVCSGSPFRFRVSLPYCADSIRWNLSNLPGPPATPPTSIYTTCSPGSGGPDSTTLVNGKTIYWYSLPSLYNFTAVGTYPVTITSYFPNGECGNSQDIDFDLQVSSPPIPGYTMILPGCYMEPVQFIETTSQSPKPTYKWFWDFGDGNTSAAKNPTHIYAAPGTYNTRYASITTPGCLSDTVKLTITIPDVPSATISGTANMCINTGSTFVTFTATNGQAPYQFFYNINGGPAQSISSTGINNTISIAVPSTAAGTFIYSLDSVKNVGSTLCTKAISGQSATVIVSPDATISLTSAAATDNQTLCINTLLTNITYAVGGGAAGATITGLPAGVTGTYNAGVFTITGTPTVSGTFTYTVTTSGICIQKTATGTILVNPDAGITLTTPGTDIQSLCINTPISAISYTITGGGSGAIVSGLPPGVASTFSGGTVTLSGSPAVTGTYNYTITTTGICVQKTVNGTITVNPDAAISLTSAPATANQTLCINNTITSISYAVTGGGTGAAFTGLPAGVTGVFTAGNILISGTPTVSGTFNYTVTTTGTCIQKSAAGTITVNPDAAITLTSAPATTNQEICANAAITGITYSITGGGSGATVTGLPSGITGTYSGGVFSIAGIPTVSGTYNYTITTTGICVQKTASGSIVVDALPTPNFIFSNPDCENKTIVFTDASLANTGTIANIQWTFGDATTGTGSPVSHTYTNAGVYTAGLVITTSKGCQNPAAFTKLVTVTVNPQSGFIVPEVCINDVAAVFTDTSKISAGAITSWYWNFGDPVSGVLNTATTKNGTHLYTSTGSYTVKHIAYSSTGCSDTVINTIFINGANPTANFIVNNPAVLCANDSVAITNTSSVNPGTVTKVEIYWDNVNAPSVMQLDDNPFPGKIYRHLYTNFQTPLTKTYQVRFVAYSGGICFNQKIGTITVNAAPKVQFNNMPDVCYDALPFQITQASEVGGVPGLPPVYTGPGVSSAGVFSPAVAGVGTHWIKYTFTSTTGGCVDTISRPIRVLDTAFAKFSLITPTCQGSTTSFKDESIAPAGVSINNTVWDFGDGMPLENHTPGSSFSHSFAAAGTYTVKMYNTSAYGCKSTTRIKNVIISPIPNAQFSFGETSVCLPGASVSFINLSTIADGSEAGFKYAWDFGDAGSGFLNNSLAKTPPPYIYTALGPFTVSLSVTSDSGCIKSLSKIVDFIHPQPKAAFTMSKSGVCIGDAVTFTDISNGLDGTVNKWFWNFGDATTGNTKLIIHQYTDTLVYNVSLFITNTKGCNSDTVSQQFTVYPYPAFDAGPDQVVLEGGSTTLPPNIIRGTSLQYLWTPATYLNDNTLVIPTASNMLDDITYTLQVTGRGGCVAPTDKVFIKILKAPKVPNTFTPNGDGINEVWKIEYLDTYPNCRVQIFTRNGQQVFESRGYKTPWDGTIKGKPLPFDTYYYIIEPGNGRKPITGYVTIIK